LQHITRQAQNHRGKELTHSDASPIWICSCWKSTTARGRGQHGHHSLARGGAQPGLGLGGGMASSGRVAHSCGLAGSLAVCPSIFYSWAAAAAGMASEAG